MLNKLTEEQVALMHVVRDEWIAIGQATGPADIGLAKIAIAAIYQEGGLAPPEKIFRFHSPLSAAIGVTILQNRPNGRASVWASVGESVEASVWESVWESVWASVRESVRASVGESVRAMVYGNHDAAWLAFYDYFRRVGIDTSCLTPLMDLAKCCGWWAPYKHVAVIQDRPVYIKFDDQKRLHCESGPAIEYADSFAVYSWHGTRIPKAWVDKKPSAQEALSVENLEQRRAACEIVGWATIIKELKAVVVDEDNPEIGTLLSVQIPDVGEEKFLVVTCGTGRAGIALPVPPDMKTARQSNAWTYGLDAKDYYPEVRT